jgi:hypothetical protein
VRHSVPWLLIGVLLLTLAACDRVSQNASDLGVGDCFADPLPPSSQGVIDETVEDVQRSPCTEPHTGEVFVVADFPGQDAYPDEQAFEDWVRANCLDQVFQDFTGLTFEAAEDIDVGYFYPKPEGWDDGDREMTCYLAPVDGQPVSASYKQAP